MPKTIIITYGEGEAKKHSVRMSPIQVEVAPVEDLPTVTLNSPGLGDFYVSRDIMRTLGLSESGRVKVTIEAV